MRICSLLPSATEIVCALGLIDDLVAISHECDYPPEVRSKPIVTSSRIDAATRTSAEIDALVSQRLHEHSGIYALNEGMLARLNADLILTQELCDVCAVSYEQVQEAVRALHGEQTVLSLEPINLAGITATIQAVGRATGQEARAANLVTSMEAQISRLAAAAGHPAARPRVACLEWLEPPFSAGHWVPEMVRIAGGMDVLAGEGERSRRVGWEQVLAGEPEVIVLMPCGFDVGRTLIEYDRAALPDGWRRLPAAQSDCVFAVDASSDFRRPGPRVLRGIEILQELLAASASDAGDGLDWRRVPIA
jgi:iron complex transport system substrate-binding protein